MTPVEQEWFAYFLLAGIGLIDIALLLVVRWWLHRLEIKRFAREEGVSLPWSLEMKMIREREKEGK